MTPSLPDNSRIPARQTAPHQQAKPPARVPLSKGSLPASAGQLNSMASGTHATSRMDPSEIVRSGYNAVAKEYLQSRLSGSQRLPLVEDFTALVPIGGVVLDAGCGAGVPLTQRLARNYRVLGLDFSMSQLRLATGLVPTVLFACQDIASLGLAARSVDAVCSFYAIIHVPRKKHYAVLQGIHRVLRPGGYALLCLGAEDLPEELADYQGGAMYWSHFDGGTYLRMLSEVGLPAIRHEIVPDPMDGSGGHLFVLSRRAGP